MRYLGFDHSDNTEGVNTLEAVAATLAQHHEAVLAEAAEVLAWAWREFPDSHGPAEEGMEWDHDLQVSEEPGGWHAVSLTFTGSDRFAQALLATFGDDPE